MGLVEQIDKDLTASMKEQQPLKLKQVELGKPVGDAEAFVVLRTLVKQRHESAEQFRKGGRDELADKEEAEIKIVESYMPAAASEEEIDAAVAAAIAETAVANPGGLGAKDIGKVMKATMAKLAGKNADGKRVNEKVRARLGGGERE